MGFKGEFAKVKFVCVYMAAAAARKAKLGAELALLSKYQDVNSMKRLQ